MDAPVDSAVEALLSLDKTNNMSTMDTDTDTDEPVDGKSAMVAQSHSTPLEVAADLDNDDGSLASSVDCSNQGKVLQQIKSTDTDECESDTDEPGAAEKSAMVKVEPSRTSRRIAEKIDLTATDTDADEPAAKKAPPKKKQPVMSKKRAGASGKSAIVGSSRSKKTKTAPVLKTTATDPNVEALEMKITALEDAHAIKIGALESANKTLTSLKKTLEGDNKSLTMDNRRLEKAARLEDPRVAELKKEVRDLKKKNSSLEKDLEIANKKVQSLEKKDLDYKREKLAAEKEKSANAVMVQRLKNQQVNASKEAAKEVTEHRVAVGVAAAKEKIQVKETLKSDKTKARSERVAESLEQGRDTYQPFQYSNKQPARSERRGHRRSRSRSPDRHRSHSRKSRYYSSDDSYDRRRHRKKIRRSSSRHGRGYSSDDTHDRYRSRSRNRSHSRHRSPSGSPSREREEQNNNMASPSASVAAAAAAAGNSQETTTLTLTFSSQGSSKNN